MVASETAVAGFTHPNYRFKVEGLDDRWKIMVGEEAGNVLPDASLVAMRIGGIYGGIVVEPLGDVDPSNYIKLLVSNMTASLVDPEFSETETLEYKGKDARVVEIDVKVNGIPFHYRLLAFVHQGFGYQVLTWETTAKSGGGHGKEFFDAVEIVEGEITAPPVVALADSNGIGRRVHQGRFESPVFRLAVRPAEGWKLMSETELLQQTDGAEMGLKHDGLGAYVAIAPEHAAGSRREALEAAMLEDVTASVGDGGEVLEPGRFEVCGREVEFQRFVVDAGLPLRMYQGLFFEGEISYKVTAWHFEQRSGELAPAIQEGLGGVSLLTAEEAAAIGTDLAKVPDHQSAVGPEFSLRGGVYRDFESGVVWRKPDGFWRITSGDQATLNNSVISFQAEELSHGLYLQLVSESAEDWSEEDYHVAVLSNFAPEEGFGEPVSFDPVDVDGKPALVSKVSQDIQGMTMERFVVTTVRGGFGHQMQFWSWGDGVKGTPELIGKCVAGFTFPGETLVKTEKSSNTYHDHRVGYRISLPGIGWRIREDMDPTIAPIGSSVSCTRGRESVMLMGLNINDSRQAQATMRAIIENMLKINYDRASNSGSTESSTVIKGATAKVMSFEIGDRHGRAITFSHQGVIYLMIVDAGQPAAAEKLSKAVIGGFDFLP